MTNDQTPMTKGMASLQPLFWSLVLGTLVILN